MHTTAEKLCTCDLDTPKNGVPGSFCSHKVFVIAVQLRCVNENSAGRATDYPLINCTILSDTRALSGPPVHHTTAEVTLMPLGRESVPGTLCIQNVLATAHQTAGATLGRATDRSPIKMHHLERYTGPEWHAHAKTAAALHKCFNTHRRIMGSLCTQNCSQQHLR